MTMTSASPRDTVAEALAIAGRRKRLERLREELTQDTYRVVLALTDPEPEGFGYTFTQAAQMLDLSKQRLSQLVADARAHRGTPEA